MRAIKSHMIGVKEGEQESPDPSSDSTPSPASSPSNFDPLNQLDKTKAYNYDELMEILNGKVED